MSGWELSENLRSAQKLSFVATFVLNKRDQPDQFAIQLTIDGQINAKR